MKLKLILLFLCASVLAIDKLQNMDVDEAVLLAVRFHPSIHNAELDRVVDKFSLAVARNAFMPQYNLSANSDILRHDTKQDANIRIDLKSKYGTQFSLNKTFGSDNSPVTLEINQPLLRGYGSDINLLDLNSAKDQDIISKLSLQKTVINIVNQALFAYWDLMRVKQDLKVQKMALSLANRTLDAYKIKVKVGQMAQSSVEQQNTAVLTVRLALKDQQAKLKVSQQRLKMALGLDPNANISIKSDLSTLSKISLPSLKDSLHLALHNNLDLLQARLALKANKREVIRAQDMQKWQLDARAALNKDDWKAGVNLDVPIHDLARQSQLVQAKIAYQKAMNSFARQQQILISEIKSQWYNCTSQLEQIKIAVKTVQSAKHDYESAKLRRMAGINSTFEVISLQQNWTDAQLNLSALKIGYLNSLMDFHAKLGTTLKIWQLDLSEFGEND